MVHSVVSEPGGSMADAETPVPAGPDPVAPWSRAAREVPSRPQAARMARAIGIVRRARAELARGDVLMAPRGGERSVRLRAGGRPRRRGRPSGYASVEGSRDRSREAGHTRTPPTAL